MKLLEKADGKGIDNKHGRNYHRHLKLSKRRLERRRAKQQPECQPAYGAYRGWEL